MCHFLEIQAGAHARQAFKPFEPKQMLSNFRVYCFMFVVIILTDACSLVRVFSGGCVGVCRMVCMHGLPVSLLLPGVRGR